MALVKSLICCSLAFGIVLASDFQDDKIGEYVKTGSRPTQHRFRRAAAPSAAAYNVAPKDIVVSAYSNDIDPATGAFQYSYQQSNGAIVSAKGYLNQAGKQVIEGSYAFVDLFGNPVNIQYVADENGYQAVGDSVPTPDPVIAKAVAYLKTLPASPEDKQ